MVAFHEGGEFPFFPGERCCNLFKYQFCSIIFPLEIKLHFFLLLEKCVAELSSYEISSANFPLFKIPEDCSYTILLSAFFPLWVIDLLFSTVKN